MSDDVTATQSWHALAAHQPHVYATTLRELFALDPDRGNDLVVTVVGSPHGWLYMILLITAYDLGRRVKWPWMRLLLIALGGTVPFMSFVAEYYATKDVKHRLAAVQEGAPEVS